MTMLPNMEDWWSFPLQTSVGLSSTKTDPTLGCNRNVLPATPRPDEDLLVLCFSVSCFSVLFSSLSCFSVLFFSVLCFSVYSSLFCVSLLSGNIDDPQPESDEDQHQSIDGTGTSLYFISLLSGNINDPKPNEDLLI